MPAIPSGAPQGPSTGGSDDDRVTVPPSDGETRYAEQDAAVDAEQDQRAETAGEQTRRQLAYYTEKATREGTPPTGVKVPARLSSPSLDERVD